MMNAGKVIYMGDVQGPQKMSETCVKTMHAGTMRRGFTDKIKKIA
jgi:hypothetical protein